MTYEQVKYLKPTEFKRLCGVQPATFVERCLETEIEVHLNDPKYNGNGKRKSDRRNGHSRKSLKGEFGEITIEVPRDRNSEFEPQLFKKGQSLILFD